MQMHKFTSLSIVLILWFAGLCAAAQFAKIGHILPELLLLYPDTGSGLGFLVSLISLVGALLGLTAGLLVRQIGPRSILLVGLALGALVSFVQSLNLPLSIFLVSRALEGASHLAIVVAAPTLIAHFSSDKMRSAAMTLWGTFFGVSFALTAWLGLPLVAKHGVDALFFVHAVLMGIATILAFIAIPKHVTIPKNLAIQKQSAKQPSNDPWPFSLRSIYTLHKDSWTSPSIAAPAAGWLFYTITFVAMLAILPTLLPAEQRAFASTTLPLMSIVTAMTLGIFLLRRFSAVQVLCIGFVSAICCALLFLWSPKEPIFIMLLFASLGLVQGASFASIPQLNKTASEQALANGAFAQAGNLGNLCGTPLLLLLVSSSGIHAMIALVIACYVAAIMIHLFFARRRKIEGVSA